MNTEIELRQEQKVSQILIQQMNLLQMTAIELRSHLEQAYLENPFIELRESEAPSAALPKVSKEEWIFASDEQTRFEYNHRQETEEGPGKPEIKYEEGGTLAEQLLMQLQKPFSQGTKREICFYIAKNLDDRGYYREDIRDTAAHLGKSIYEVRNCLEYMKSLEPPGICAENLSECLRIQLIRKKDADLKTEIVIVNEYLDLLGKNQLHVIAKKMRIPVSRAAAAAQFIKGLNPAPGLESQNDSQTAYITPDVYVVNEDGKLSVFVNEQNTVQININKYYLDLYNSQDCDREVHTYLTEKLRQAAQLREQLANRSSSLKRVSEYIVNYQKDFFVKGKTFLRPLRMVDAADELMLSESTVSRVANGKYIQCEQGLFPFSFFFCKAFLKDEENDLITTGSIFEILSDVIAGEDKASPYSDRELCELMEMRGLRIARRTVAKYRDIMKIPDSRTRKQY